MKGFHQVFTVEWNIAIRDQTKNELHHSQWDSKMEDSFMFF